MGTSLSNTIIARKSCFIVLALFISVAYLGGTGEVGATEFDDLSEQQKEAAIALLKQAMSETNVDPLEIIRHGIEKVKKEEKSSHETSTKVRAENEDESTTEDVPPISKAIEQDTTTSSTFAKLSDNESTATTSTPDTISPSPVTSSPSLSEHQVEESHDYEEQVSSDYEEQVPSEHKEQVSSEHVLAQTQPNPTLSAEHDNLEENEPAEADENEELVTAESTTERSIDNAANHGSNPMLNTPTVVQSNLIDDSYKKVQNQQAKATELLHKQAELGKEPETLKYPDVVVPNKEHPVEEDFEDTYIDRSDPINPRKVQIKKKNKSRVGPDGARHEQLESKVITSIGNNPNAYSRHSSSSSFSSSSSTNGKRPGKNWVFDQMQRLPKLPSMPQIPPIPPLPPMPLMPYGMPITGAWSNYYGQGMEDFNEFAGHGAYATAMAGLPGAYYGYPTKNERYISKRQAKKQRRAARRAARERKLTY